MTMSSFITFHLCLGETIVHKLYSFNIMLDNDKEKDGHFSIQTMAFSSSIVALAEVRVA